MKKIIVLPFLFLVACGPEYTGQGQYAMVNGIKYTGSIEGFETTAAEPDGMPEEVVLEGEKIVFDENGNPVQ